MKRKERRGKERRGELLPVASNIEEYYITSRTNTTENYLNNNYRCIIYRTVLAVNIKSRVQNDYLLS